MSTMPDKWHDAHHGDEPDPACIYCAEEDGFVHTGHPQVWPNFIDNPPHDTLNEQEGEGAS